MGFGEVNAERRRDLAEVGQDMWQQRWRMQRPRKGAQPVFEVFQAPINYNCGCGRLHRFEA